MTLGNAAAARVRLIVWCKACGRRVEPDAAEMAERYGADSAVPEWRERLVCSRCGSRNVEHRGDRDRAAVALTAPPHLNLPADRSRPLRAIPPCRRTVGATGKRTFIGHGLLHQTGRLMHKPGSWR